MGVGQMSRQRRLQRLPLLWLVPVTVAALTLAMTSTATPGAPSGTEAGYNVTIQTYKFDYFAYTALPVLSEVSPTAHDYVVSTDFNPGQSTGTANASSLQPAGGIIIPPTSTPSSSSGCTASDFSGF